MFRKYDPSAGRWLSPDPSGWDAVNLSAPQSLNRYSYVLNNPTSLLDPTGLDCVWMNDVGTVSGIQGDCQDYGPSADGFYVDCYGCVVDGNGNIINDTLSWDSSQNLIGYCIGQACYDGNGNLMAQPTTVDAQIYGWASGNSYGATSITVGVLPSSTSPGGGGSSYSFVAQWWKDVKNCVGNYGIPTLARDLNPIPSGDDTAGILGSLQSVADQAKQNSLLAVGVYSVGKGLTVPLRSSAVRAGLKTVEALGKASDVLLVGVVAWAGYDAIREEWDNCL